ncbi:type II toxin-antitoxin system VapC family toxin [Candidatus Palauibacter sp.]|uniref:type II toxin-antitoxin system VapC family toxin n=1 Tax=Candidatus Palauibacter sp. TaxID=3101350 RepID=UPI003B01BA0E
MSSRAMGTLLDTNVVSELIRRSPKPAVAAWASGHLVEDLFFSAVSEAELRYGVAILPVGRRRDTLLFEIEAMLRDAFEDRVLPFDSDAARAYGHIAAKRRSSGRPVSPADCQIAAIAASRRMTVATRNVRDFEGMGIEIVDPWAAT